MDAEERKNEFAILIKSLDYKDQLEILAYMKKLKEKADQNKTA